MNWNAIRYIIRKDLKVVFQNKGGIVPFIILPIVMLVGVPAVARLVPMGYLTTTDAAWLDNMIQRLPGIQATLAGYDKVQRFVVAILVYLAMPLYLILPLFFSITIACDSFVGEKERKTLEALLYTPTTDWELLLGKLLSAWLPAVGVAWGGFLVYAVMANLAAWPFISRLFFPNTIWVILALWVAPSVAGLGLSTMVQISSRARTFQEAYQLGGVLVLPILILFSGQLIGVMQFSTWLVALLGLMFWVIDAALLWFGRRSFQRNKLATQI
jgi:ABC-2 type transport system permease protein